MRGGYLVLLSLALLAAEPVLAASVRVDFSGTVYDGSNVLIGGSIAPGTPFTGYFTFDDSTAPTVVSPEEPGEIGYAGYEFSAPTWAFHTDVGNVTTDVVPNPNFPSPMGGYFLGIRDAELDENQFEPSWVDMSVYVGVIPIYQPGGPWVPTLVTVSLVGASEGLPLHSTEIASVPWSVLAFPDTRVQWYINNGDENRLPIVIEGHIEEFSVSVPEPASAAFAAIAALALIGLGFARAQS